MVSVAAAVGGARAGRDCKMTQAVGSSGALDEEACQVACEIMSRALVASLKGAKEIPRRSESNACRAASLCGGGGGGGARSGGGFTLCRKGRLLVDLAMERGAVERGVSQ